MIIKTEEDSKDKIKLENYERVIWLSKWKCSYVELEKSRRSLKLFQIKLSFIFIYNIEHKWLQLNHQLISSLQSL